MANLLSKSFEMDNFSIDRADQQITKTIHAIIKLQMKKKNIKKNINS